MPLKAGIGSILGYCAGTFAKQNSKIFIKWIGIAVSFLAWVNYAKYITINWRKIDSDIFHSVAKSRKRGDTSAWARLHKFITHTVPLMTGASAAFYYGFKHADYKK